MPSPLALWFVQFVSGTPVQPLPSNPLTTSPNASTSWTPSATASFSPSPAAYFTFATPGFAQFTQFVSGTPVQPLPSNLLTSSPNASTSYTSSATASSSPSPTAYVTFSMSKKWTLLNKMVIQIMICLPGHGAAGVAGTEPSEPNPTLPPHI
ncbi:hypothetical protein F5888DRAFT_1807593 [Russula emetica]|nr:hypothetical protein F5888DRAFT_1807593 [Russula emetica]